MMPDNTNRGTLETFLKRLVPEGNLWWLHAATATAEAQRLGAPLASKDQDKGALHAWLAWQEKPGLPFGTALSAQILGHESPEALGFVAWFSRLFLD